MFLQSRLKWVCGHALSSESKAHPEIILVEETGARRYQAEVHAGATAFFLDKPLAFAGLGSGPDPYDLI
ncbi:MAG: hypothetical protein ABI810_02670 [Sphingomonas bacterium]